MAIFYPKFIDKDYVQITLITFCWNSLGNLKLFETLNAWILLILQWLQLFKYVKNLILSKFSVDAKKIFESPCAMHSIEFQFFNVIKWKRILFNLSLFLLFVLLSSQLTLSYFWKQLLLIKFWMSKEKLLQNCSWYFDIWFN